MGITSNELGQHKLNRFGNCHGYNNLGKDPDIRLWLGSKLAHQLQLFKNYLIQEQIFEVESFSSSKDGKLLLDTLLFNYIGSLGKESQEIVLKLAEKSHERHEVGHNLYKLWLIGADSMRSNSDGAYIPKFVLVICRALLFGNEGQSIVRAKENIPALSEQVHELLSGLIRPGTEIHGRQARHLVVCDSKEVVGELKIPSITTEAIEILYGIDRTLTKKFSIMRSLLGQRVIRYLNRAFHANYFLAIDRNPSVIVIDGGSTGFAACLGVGSSRKSIGAIREILLMGQQLYCD